MSDVSDPIRSSSPLDLNEAKDSSITAHSVITCFNFASISFSFTALMQISYRDRRYLRQIKTQH